MITEDYVSFEIAKLLKEKGFDEPTYRAYCETNREHRLSYDVGRTNSQWDKFNKEDGIFNCGAPTLQMAMKWLREAHNLNIGILFGRLRDFKTHWNFYIEDIKLGRESLFFHTYEEACEAAIKYCLKNLI